MRKSTKRYLRLIDVDVERLADERVARDAHLELLEADPAVRVEVGLLQPHLDIVLERVANALVTTERGCLSVTRF